MIDLTNEFKRRARDFEKAFGRKVDPERDIVSTCLGPMEWSLVALPGDELWALMGIKIGQDLSIPYGEIRISGGMAPQTSVSQETPVSVLPPKRRIKI